jgi:hypothetical protein
MRKLINHGRAKLAAILILAACLFSVPQLAASGAASPARQEPTLSERLAQLGQPVRVMRDGHMQTAILIEWSESSGDYEAAVFAPYDIRVGLKSVVKREVVEPIGKPVDVILPSYRVKGLSHLSEARAGKHTAFPFVRPGENEDELIEFYRARIQPTGP